MDTKFICEFCDNQFASHVNLKNHVATAKYCIKQRSATSTKHNDVKFQCEFCERIFLRKGILADHLKTCKVFASMEECKKIEESKNYKAKFKLISKENKKLIQEKDKLEVELDSEKDTTCELEIVVEKQNERIRELELELARKDGRIDVLSTIKPTKNTIINNNGGNNYLNHKIAALPIENVRPLTIEYVQSLAEGYTYEYFMRGPLGIAQFMASFVNIADEDDLDAPPKRNYACTDAPRHKFHKFDTSGWKLDMGATFIGEVLNEIRPVAQEHFNLLTDKSLTDEDPMMRQIYEKKKIKTISPMMSGINFEKDNAREQLISEIRVHLRPFVTI